MKLKALTWIIDCFHLGYIEFHYNSGISQNILMEAVYFISDGYKRASVLAMLHNEPSCTFTGIKALVRDIVMYILSHISLCTFTWTV